MSEENEEKEIETVAETDTDTEGESSAFESDVDYNTVLDVFEGPLDLLLHLINTAKINIDDIFVSEVTDQFLDYIEFMKTKSGRDVDKESEYLAIAAQIIYLKSKSLVPSIAEYDENYVTPIDEEQKAFIDQLKQRQLELIQEEAQKLKESEIFGFAYKAPEKEYATPKIVYKDFTVDGLLRAFARLMLKNESMKREEENSKKEIPMDIYTVPDKIRYIRACVIEKGEVSFDSLFDSYSKNEVVTTFQALLEMLKLQYIMVEQEDEFSEITIKLNPEWDLTEVSDETEQYD
ncbi:MAG: segregation/condensation protein A [Clostridia bacterium]|nr:segregation/condensation protein A [Clostridia bacterium]